ncbi:hypothetical protein ES703_98918 [subsurface metagenome]
MIQLFSATRKRLNITMTKRNKNIIDFLKNHGESTLADVANEIQTPLNTTLVELKYLGIKGFVKIKGSTSVKTMIIKKEDKELIEAMVKIKPKPIKKRKRKTRKKKQKPEEKYIADLDKWFK